MPVSNKYRRLLLLTCLFGGMSGNTWAASAYLYELSLEELLQVKIETAGKRLERVNDIPASVNIISRADIAAYGYSSLTDILEDVPGFFNIDSYSEVSGNFGVRGLWNSRDNNSSFAILVNGVSQARRDARSNPFSKLTLPVEAIDRIEIIRGPMSTIYGNGAAMGVINIVTNEFKSKDRFGLMSTSYGPNHTKKAAMRFESGEDKRAFIANIGYHSSDGLDHPIQEMVSEQNYALLSAYGVEDPEAYNFDGKLENDWRYVDLSGRWDNWFIDASYKRADVERFLVLPALENGTKLKSNAIDFLLGHRQALNNKLTFTNKFTYSNIEREQIFDLLARGEMAGFNTLDYEAYNFESDVNYDLNSDLALVAGVDYELMKGFYEFTHAPVAGFINESVAINDRERASLFFQATYQATPKLNVVAGYRHEMLGRHTRDGIALGGTPDQYTFGGRQGGFNNSARRLAFVYHHNEKQTYKALYGVAHQIASDRFDAETTETFELSYTYHASSYRCHIALFNNEMDDLIVDVLVLNDDGSVSNSTGPGGHIIAQGIELELHGEISQRLSSSIGMTYQASEDQLLPDVDLAYSPEKVVHGKLKYQLGDYSFALTGRYIDKIFSYYDTSVELGDGNYGARIGDAAPSYFVVDLNARKHNLIGKSYVNLKLTNIFSQEVRYPNNRFNSELLNRGTLGEKFSVTLSLGANF